MNPTVSFIIVFRNAKNHLIQAIESFSHQTYPKELLELILVDGFSEDGSWEIAQNKVLELSQAGIKAKLLRNHKKTLAPGWNLAIKNSENDIVCRIDCHGSIGPDYIEMGVKRLVDGKNASIAAVGSVLENCGEGFWGRIFRDFYSSKFGVGNSPFRTVSKGVFFSDTVAMGLYWKSIFDEIGDFDEDLPRNQDIALHHKILQRGYRLQTDASLKFKYIVRSDPKALLKKAWEDGFWIIPSGGGRLRHFIPMLFLVYVFFLGISRFFRCLKPFRLLISFPAILYLLLSFFYAQKDGRSWARLFLPLVFPLYHLVYGFATICGAFYAKRK